MDLLQLAKESPPVALALGLPGMAALIISIVALVMVKAMTKDLQEHKKSVKDLQRRDAEFTQSVSELKEAISVLNNNMDWFKELVRKNVGKI